jgi:hypothetical protein
LVERMIENLFLIHRTRVAMQEVQSVICWN